VQSQPFSRRCASAASTPSRNHFSDEAAANANDAAQNLTSGSSESGSWSTIPRGSTSFRAGAGIEEAPHRAMFNPCCCESRASSPRTNVGPSVRKQLRPSSHQAEDVCQRQVQMSHPGPVEMSHPEAVVSLCANLSTGGVAHATQTPTVVKSSPSCAVSTSSDPRLWAERRLHGLRALCRLRYACRRVASAGPARPAMRGLAACSRRSHHYRCGRAGRSAPGEGPGRRL